MSSNSCIICGQNFATRNKLFNHISQTGHAAPVGGAVGGAKEDRKQVKKSKKSKTTSIEYKS